ncbi:MAG TPA: hypothetical protein PLP21_14645 [Pyrinomonadaceae bacterium]|nr:hypothetical protein [Acidobacteriota bacterium]HQZ97558.1 hypothetical protein [Pyrinomonadaceae bacterium]
MLKDLSISVLIFLVSIGAGCGGSAGVPAGNSANKNGNVSNANAATPVNAVPANLPAGVSTTPLSPANAANVSAANGATPKPVTTPGIPSPAELKKQAKPGTTPTPGIPSADEMRKAFSKPAANANSASPSMMKEVPMMRSTKPANKP